MVGSGLSCQGATPHCPATLSEIAFLLHPPQQQYPSTGYVDELAWAAAWLYKATGQASYLTDARKYYAGVRIFLHLSDWCTE